MRSWAWKRSWESFEHVQNKRGNAGALPDHKLISTRAPLSRNESGENVGRSLIELKVFTSTGIEHEGHIKSVFMSHFDRNLILMGVSGAWKDLETSQLRSYVDRDWSVNSVIRSYIYNLNKASSPWIYPTSPDLPSINPDKILGSWIHREELD